MVMESLDAQPGPADRSHASPAPPGDTRVPTTSGHGVAISRSGDPGLESACRPSTRSNPSASPPGFGLSQEPGGLIGVPDFSYSRTAENESSVRLPARMKPVIRKALEALDGHTSDE
jgi:hypothetical protein